MSKVRWPVTCVNEAFCFSAVCIASSSEYHATDGTRVGQMFRGYIAVQLQ